MSDNTQANAATAPGGDTIRTVDRGAAKTQVVQLDIGGENAEALAAGSLPVQINDTNGDIAQVDGAGNLQVVEKTLQSAVAGDAPLFVVLTGNPSGDFAGVDLLEQALQDNSGIGFNVKILNPSKQDVNGAIIESDAPAPILINAPVGALVIIDTTGYDSLNITTQTLAGNITTSNDLKTWSALTGIPLAIGGYVTAIAASTGYSFPCIARYIAITPTTAGTATAYLRSAAWNPNYTTAAGANVAQIGGTAVVAGGVAGIQAIGGNVAPGGTATANPLPVGGVDAANLTRRLLTDTVGRVQTALASADSAGVTRTSVLLPNIAGGAPLLAVADLNATEGQSIPELLLQVLNELKITNHLVYLLLSQPTVTPADEPSALRADPSFFAQ